MPHPSKAGSEPGKQGASDPAFHGTVLVVDDEECIRSVASMMLEHAGYTTLQACDGVEAVDMLHRHADAIDCVLLDITMPRMDGEQAFYEMRRIKPQVRVVLSSGYCEQTAALHFGGKGLAGFVQKPYTPESLLDTVGGVVQRARAASDRGV